MRRGFQFASAIFLSLSSVAAAPATRPAAAPTAAEVEALRAENARLRVEVERLKASTRPATAPASQPSANGEMSVQQLVGLIPPAILYPDRPGLVGGSNSLTQQRLHDWIEKNYPGKRLRATVPFRGNGAIHDDEINVSFGDTELPMGKKKFSVRISSNDGGYRNVRVPATQANTLLKMHPNKDTIQVAGTITSFVIDNEAIIIVAESLEATLPAK